MASGEKQDLGFTLVDPTAFHGKGFSVEGFLVELTKDVIPQQAKGPLAAGRDAFSANEQVQRVQKLLGVLERCARGRAIARYTRERAVRTAHCALEVRDRVHASRRCAHTKRNRKRPNSLSLPLALHPHPHPSPMQPTGPRPRSARSTRTTPARSPTCAPPSPPTRRSTA